MNKIKTITVLLLCLSLSSCLARYYGPRISANMEEFCNRPVSEMLASWGPPSLIMDDGSGGRVYIYVKSRGSYTPAKTETTIKYIYTHYGGGATSNTTYTPEVVARYDAYRMFFVTSKGYIYNWSWKGL